MNPVCRILLFLLTPGLHAEPGSHACPKLLIGGGGATGGLKRKCFTIRQHSKLVGYPSVPALLAALICATAPLSADVNVLILGSDSSGDRFYKEALTQGQETGTPPFHFAEVASHLRGILQGAGLGAVNVTTENLARGDIDLPNPSNWFQSNLRYSSNLISWFYWPYGDFKGGAFSSVTGTEAPRWANLRGEGETKWDFVVLIEDPATIERYPGLHAVGVARISEEVAKGTGQAVLLMPWPAPGSGSSVDHYREVAYRVGRSAGIPVAPAGMAWQAAGSPTGNGHPSTDGAFIAAATLYSRIFGHSASGSSYDFNDTLADTAHATVQANQGAPQYNGTFASPHPTRMLGDKRRFLRHSNRGTSTENRWRREFSPDSMLRVNVDGAWTRETYNSDTPDDDGLGWPYSGGALPTAMNYGRHHSFSGDGPAKSYFTNSNFWQLGFGFAYQNTTDSVRVRGLMGSRDFYVAFLMNEGTVLPTMPQTDPMERADEIETARLVPIHLFYSELQRHYPGESFLPDGTHMNRAMDVAAATYMLTIYSGRTPVDDLALGGLQVPDPELHRFAQMLGYETAWMAGTLQARAPAFKVTPANKNTGTATESFTVRFLNPPQEDVTVHIGVSDPALAEVSHDSLVFTPEDHAVPRFVTSRARNRNNASNPTYSVEFTTTSEDGVYDGLSDSWSFNMPANAAPSVDIVEPTEGRNFPVNANLAVNVDSIDPDGSVAHVTLWINDVLVREDNSAPYRWSAADGDAMLANLAEDAYRLEVRSVDNQGAAYALIRNITVGDPASTPPAPPANLRASTGYNLVTLAWDENTEGDFHSYSVYRSTAPGDDGSMIASGLASNGYEDTDVESGTSYFYVVAAKDIFGNVSGFSNQIEAVPSLGPGAVLFGSSRDGYGGFTASVPNRGGIANQESWTLLPDRLRYINDDPDGINNGLEGGTRNGSLLKQIPIDRSDGTSHLVQGVVRLEDGYADDNNRIGIYLFGSMPDLSVSGGESETGAIYLNINLDTGAVNITRGLNGTILATTPKLGALQGNALFGRELIFIGNVSFTGTSISIAFTLRDEDHVETTVTATVPAASHTGNHFGFGTRTRTRGIGSRTNTWTTDYRSFRLADLGAPDAPTGLSAVAQDGHVQVRWTPLANPPNATYRLYRSTTSGQFPATPYATNLTSAQFLDGDVDDGVSYHYAVTAVSQDGRESAFSEAVSLTYFPHTFVDANQNGIDDSWETSSFGRLLEEDEVIHESGVPYFFMYLHGTDPDDPSDRFRFSAAPDSKGQGVVFFWEVLERFALGTHYEMEISTDLTNWDPIPEEHYTVQQTTENGRTEIELTVIHNYGNRVFVRLVKP
jgi:hypothetical protein